tara:strand:- start:586 stop:834 length:249 start_codon:yes stop_codon:yes gene_type:complete
MEDALTLQKRKSSDEFLIEKKSPLVLPPNYGELPEPQKNYSNQKSEEKEKETISSNEEIKINKIIKNSTPSDLEKSVVEKMK